MLSAAYLWFLRTPSEHLVNTYLSAAYLWFLRLGPFLRHGLVLGTFNRPRSLVGGGPGSDVPKVLYSDFFIKKKDSKYTEATAITFEDVVRGATGSDLPAPNVCLPSPLFLPLGPQVCKCQ